MSYRIGECKNCGNDVIEELSYVYDKWEEQDSDYRNRCTNRECGNCKWHYVNIGIKLNYYNTNTVILTNINKGEMNGK